MRYPSSYLTVLLAVFLLLPLLGLSQEVAPPEKQAPKDQAPTPRLDLYGDSLPEGAIARMGTVRLRPGEFLDFLLGRVGIEIAGDDSHLEPPDPPDAPSGGG